MRPLCQCLVTEYVSFCATSSLCKRVSGSKGEEYSVAVFLDPVMDECNCKGYQFRRECKHVKALREEFCGWRQGVGPEVQTPQQEMEAVCPRCGEETAVEAVPF